MLEEVQHPQESTDLRSLAAAVAAGLSCCRSRMHPPSHPLFLGVIGDFSVPLGSAGWKNGIFPDGPSDLLLWGEREAGWEAEISPGLLMPRQFAEDLNLSLEDINKLREALE